MMSYYNILKNRLLFKKYKVTKILGKGSFACVFQGVNIKDNSDIAMKIERKKESYHLLELESSFLSLLKGYGIPQLKSYGISGSFYILVEELLGCNLAQIKRVKKNFTLKDLSMLAIQIMDRIEYVHSKYIIHRDIKPENFTIGYKNPSIIYIIDFGISKKYKSSRTGKHVRFSITGKLFGTIRYISYNGSRGVEASRRDDLESIGYMLIYLYKGKLPWQNMKLKDKNIKRRYLEMLYLKKFTTPEKLCTGLPPEFAEYIKYSKDLSFEQDPDYEYLRNLFKSVLLKSNQINDMKFSWINNNDNNDNNDNNNNINNNLLTKNNSKKKFNVINVSKEKYINLLLRKESPQIRLYKAIQHSLDKKVTKHPSKSELSCEQKNIFVNKKIKVIKKRGVSVDTIQKIKNELNNSDLSKDLLTYNSLLAQYNLNIIGFQDEKKIFELYDLNRNKMNKLSPNKYNSKFNISNSNILSYSKNQNDLKSSDFNYNNIIKKSFNSLLNDKNDKNKKLNSKINKKRFNISVDLDKNYLKDSFISEGKTRSNSEKVKNNLNKKIKLTTQEIKRKNICKKIYMNIINKINLQLNSFLMINNNNNILKNQVLTYKPKFRKRNNIVGQNLISKFNSSEDNFSFKNRATNNNLNTGNNNTNIIHKNNYTKKNQINNSNLRVKNNNINTINTQKIFIKINEEDSITKTKINTDNVSSNNSLLENKKQKNDGRINIIINNNENSFRNISNEIIYNKKYNMNSNSKFDSEDNITMEKTRTNNNSKSQKNSNDEIIENDYKSYHYISEIHKNDNQNVNNNNLIKYKYKPIQINHLQEKTFSNITNKNIEYKNNYKNNNTNTPNNNNIYNDKNIPIKRNVKTLELKPIYNYTEKSKNLENNAINNYNYKKYQTLQTYTNSESLNNGKNSYLLDKMKTIQLNNKTQNTSQIKTPPKSYITKLKMNNNNINRMKNNHNNSNTNNNISNIKIYDSTPIKNNTIINKNNNNITSIKNCNIINMRNNNKSPCNVYINKNLHQNNFTIDTNLNKRQKYINNENNQNYINSNRKNYINSGRNTYYYSPDIIKNNNYEYKIDARSADNIKNTTNRNVSNNMKKKGLNYNYYYIQDSERINYNPKNINNLNNNVNKIIGSKCFNIVQI